MQLHLPVWREWCGEIQRPNVLFFYNKQHMPIGCHISHMYDTGFFLVGPTKQHDLMGSGPPSLDWLSQPLVIPSHMVSFACDASRIGNLNRMLEYIARPDGVGAWLPSQACSKSHSIAFHVMFFDLKVNCPTKRHPEQENPTKQSDQGNPTNWPHFPETNWPNFLFL